MLDVIGEHGLFTGKIPIPRKETFLVLEYIDSFATRYSNKSNFLNLRIIVEKGDNFALHQRF